MLALRNATRFRARPNLISLSARQCRPIQPRLYHPATQTYSWKAWFFHRRDGTRRSKLTGAVLATTLAATSYFFLTLMEVLQELYDANYGLQALVLLQRLDIDYSSYDFNKPADTIAYMARVVGAMPDLDKKQIDKFMYSTDILVHSNKEAHIILRQCFEELHQVIENGNRQSPLETAEQVLEALNNGLTRLLEASDDNYKQVGRWMKDRISSGGDSSYDVLG